MNDKIKESLESAITLLESSIHQLRFSLLRKDQSTNVESMTDILALIEPMVDFNKSIREYLNKVEDQDDSKKVEFILKNLTDSLKDISSVEEFGGTDISKAARKALQKVEQVCPDNIC
ncbi:MAG: hypothetical protein KME12_14335 [Trichocoleus desertorum ATA4-8-CV12]|jgi:predicted RNA-binding protein with EMAP domain|nr:hypothetical protein [Trichocoleus desertorum ATA4-8-CV12]